jgi:hypothetical protein
MTLRQGRAVRPQVTSLVGGEQDGRRAAPPFDCGEGSHVEAAARAAEGVLAQFVPAVARIRSLDIAPVLAEHGAIIREPMTPTPRHLPRPDCGRGRLRSQRLELDAYHRLARVHQPFEKRARPRAEIDASVGVRRHGEGVGGGRVVFAGLTADLSPSGEPSPAGTSRPPSAPDRGRRTQRWSPTHSRGSSTLPGRHTRPGLPGSPICSGHPRSSSAGHRAPVQAGRTRNPSSHVGLRCRAATAAL